MLFNNNNNIVNNPRVRAKVTLRATPVLLLSLNFEKMQAAFAAKMQNLERFGSSLQIVFGESLKLAASSHAMTKALQNVDPGDINGSSLQVERRGPKKGARRREMIRLGKDEMNLVEHPFGVLWPKETENSVMFYHWDATHPITGKVLPASWMVSGHADHGLPNASDERIYLVLMELTREAGFTSPTVHFSRHDLIKRLGWPDTSQSYDMIERGFERLQGVTINAKNAFWNHREKTYVNAGFNVLDHFVINAERPGPKSVGRSGKPVSFFCWSDFLFHSFENGYIRSLDLDFALSLQSDIALRLYRYLDKKAYDGRPSFEVDIFNLCIGHLGMKPNLFPSKLKERLKPAHDELIARGFLHEVEYEKTRTPERKSLKVRYHFSARILAPVEEAALMPVQGELELFGPVTDSTSAGETTSSSETSSSSASEEWSDEQRELLARMEGVKVSSPIAHELLRNNAPSALRHQLDCLADRKPRSKAATFVKSVRELWALPDEYVKRLEAQEAELNRRVEFDLQEAEKARQKAAERAQEAQSEEEAVRLDAMWDKLDEITRARIDAQVMGKLGILGRTGRGDAAKIAFRRAALRELLQAATATSDAS